MKFSLLSLVGAGPGDPELITLKAIRCLEKADVILYDALANECLLDHAHPGAIKRFVGKRFGCHSLSQDEINTLILEYTATYKYVVRLKGGDPFVFGRAQEEIDIARAAGVNIEIIPGISSALAVPALHMIPPTNRGMAESFWVLTGMTKSGDISNDIKLAAQSSATVIILMAMSKLEPIMELFKAQGKKDMPVAIIQNGTITGESWVIGTVNDIVFKSELAGLTNPAIIVVGEVVTLHPSFVRDELKKTGVSSLLHKHH